MEKFYALDRWNGSTGLVMMITSLDDDNAMPLMRAEVPGPEADKLVPKGKTYSKDPVWNVFCIDGSGDSLFDGRWHELL